MPSMKFMIDSKDLSVIRETQQRITLAKAVSSDSPTPEVIWLSIEPVENVSVSWKEEDYGIYVMTAPVSKGETIDKSAETGMPAQVGAYYKLDEWLRFNGPFTDRDDLKKLYAVQNDVPFCQNKSLSFGLTQSVTVNNQVFEMIPLCAVMALATEFIQIPPHEIVFVWLQLQLAGETIDADVIGKIAQINFSNATDVTLKYDPNLGLFIDAEPNMLQAGHSAIKPISMLKL